ncbi:MAG: hypothetical protein LBN18_06505, partial [Dysgonamonadaceae bacterium]|nr:hypothetical protein [Dysgonamonadaceae bacterium]
FLCKRIANITVLYENGKNKSRRHSFKERIFQECSKKTLPILGMMALVNMPTITKAAETMVTSCQFGCQNSCSGSCGGACSYNCQNTCSGTCQNRCSGWNR